MDIQLNLNSLLMAVDILNHLTHLLSKDSPLNLSSFFYFIFIFDLIIYFHIHCKFIQNKWLNLIGILSSFCFLRQGYNSYPPQQQSYPPPANPYGYGKSVVFSF